MKIWPEGKFVMEYDREKPLQKRIKRNSKFKIRRKFKYRGVKNIRGRITDTNELFPF